MLKKASENQFCNKTVVQFSKQIDAIIENLK